MESFVEWLSSRSVTFFDSWFGLKPESLGMGPLMLTITLFGVLGTVSMKYYSRKINDWISKLKIWPENKEWVLLPDPQIEKIEKYSPYRLRHNACYIIYFGFKFNRESKT